MRTDCGFPRPRPFQGPRCGPRRGQCLPAAPPSCSAPPRLPARPDRRGGRPVAPLASFPRRSQTRPCPVMPVRRALPCSPPGPPSPDWRGFPHIRAPPRRLQRGFPDRKNFPQVPLRFLHHPGKRRPHHPKRGEVPEWSNGAVSKTVEPSRVPWVRIPPSPPLALAKAFSPSGCGQIFSLY